MNKKVKTILYLIAAGGCFIQTAICQKLYTENEHLKIELFKEEDKNNILEIHQAGDQEVIRFYQNLLGQETD